MKARLFAVAMCAVLVMLLSGCNSLKRVGTDVAVVAWSPVNIPLAAVSESMDWGPETGSPHALVLAPVAIMGRMLKHSAYTVAHAADLLIAPFYLLAGVGSDTDLEPLNLYSFDGFGDYFTPPFPSSAVPAIEE